MMSTIISNSDFANDVIAAVNEAAGDTVLDATMSATEAIAAVNETAGDDVLDVSMYAEDVVDAVNEIDFDGGNNVLRFLHISDTHGTTTALSKCKELLENDGSISHLIITGDMTSYSTKTYPSTTINLINGIKALGDKLLLVAGNHDVYDNTHSNLGSSIYVQDDKIASEKNWMRSVMGNNVTFGTDGAQGLYWHKDIHCGNHTLRVIGIENYAANGKERNAIVYTEAMVNWLISLLLNTPSSYYLLFLAHTPSVESPSVPDAAITGVFVPKNAEEAAGEKLFTSELMDRWYNVGLRDYNLMPRILRAYMHKESINFAYTTNTTTESQFQVTADFSQNNPATVVGWASGHIHCDYVGYIPYADWADQLLLGVTAGDSSVVWSRYDDLLYGQAASQYGGTQYASSEPTYRINEYVIDLDNKTLTIKRHGNKTTSTQPSENIARKYGGRVRDEVTFNLRKENDHD